MLPKLTEHLLLHLFTGNNSFPHRLMVHSISHIKTSNFSACQENREKEIFSSHYRRLIRKEKKRQAFNLTAKIIIRYFLLISSHRITPSLLSLHGLLNFCPHRIPEQEEWISRIREVRKCRRGSFQTEVMIFVKTHQQYHS